MKTVYSNFKCSETGLKWNRFCQRENRSDMENDYLLNSTAARQLKAERLEYIRTHPERRRLAAEFLEGVASIARKQVGWYGVWYCCGGG